MESLLDRNRGVANVNGNERLFEKLLHEFCTDHHTDVERIRGAMSSRDFETAHRIAHTLKGVSGTLGANRIATIAARVDMSLRNGQVPAESDMTELGASMMRLTDIVGVTVLPKASAEYSGNDDYSSAVSGLREMIEQMSPAAEDRALSISAELSNINEDLTQQLISRLKDFEFEGALESLTQLERSLIARGEER